MSIDIVTLRLTFVLLPGVLAYGLIAALAPQRDRSQTVMALQVIMLGLASYALVALAAKLVPEKIAGAMALPSTPLIFQIETLDPKTPINFIEIVYGVAMAILLGVVVSLNVNCSLMIRLCRLARLTNRHGDADTWSYLFNSSSIDAWVTVRM